MELDRIEEDCRRSRNCAAWASGLVMSGLALLERSTGDVSSEASIALLMTSLISFGIGGRFVYIYLRERRVCSKAIADIKSRKKDQPDPEPEG